MKIKLATLAMIILFMLVQSPLHAKVLPRFGKTKKVAPKASSGKANNYVSAKLRDDRKALLVTFSNLGSVKSIDYTLTYDSATGPQGVNGSVEISGSSISRELVFGTASKNVYTYHTALKNMKFVVTIVLKNGSTIVKKYTVKP